MYSFIISLGTESSKIVTNQKRRISLKDIIRISKENNFSPDMVTNIMPLGKTTEDELDEYNKFVESVSFDTRLVSPNTVRYRGRNYARVNSTNTCNGCQIPRDAGLCQKFNRHFGVDCTEKQYHLI